MAASKFNRLLVEGLTDLVAIAELSEGNGIPWPKGDEPVCIIPLGTKTPKKSIVENELKARDVNSWALFWTQTMTLTCLGNS